MDKKQFENLLTLSQIGSGLNILYAFLEEAVPLNELPEELRDDTESLYKSLGQLGEKFSDYCRAAIDKFMLTILNND